MIGVKENVTLACKDDQEGQGYFRTGKISRNQSGRNQEEPRTIPRRSQPEIKKLQTSKQEGTRMVSFSNSQKSTQEVKDEYSCHFCDKVYVVKASYQSHMRKKHSEQVQSAK